MAEWLKILIEFVFAPMLLSGAAIYAAVRVSKSQSRSYNGDAVDKFSQAAARQAERNERLERTVTELEARLEALAGNQCYRVTVIFQNTNPPTIKEARVEPIPASI